MRGLELRSSLLRILIYVENTLVEFHLAHSGISIYYKIVINKDHSEGVID